MKTTRRAIVLRAPNGDDYIHVYPHIEYESLHEYVQAHGEESALDTLNKAYSESQRNMSKWDANREMQNQYQPVIEAKAR